MPVESLLKHWPRILVTLLPLVLVLMHSVGAVNIGFIQRLDDIIYDARLRATMPGTQDERIVIVDIDEKSLAEVGRWPWGRNRMAELTRELLDAQSVALLGFDIVFAEADESSGLKRLTELAKNELKGQAGFLEKLQSLQGVLDYDAAFARAIDKRPVVLGYYLTSDRDGRSSGVLPDPVMAREVLQGRPSQFTSWNGYGSNIEMVAKSAPAAGFFNSITEADGVVRSLPMIAEYKNQYYESLALAMFRALIGSPTVSPGFAQGRFISPGYPGLESILLKLGDRKVYAIPVDDRASTLVPFRGFGGPAGGAFKYVSAVDILAKRLPVGTLKNKIILVGTTAPGLVDLRVTPVGETYPGVETHANVISGLLDGKVLVRPDYAVGYDVVLLVASGLALAFGLPFLSASRAVMLSVSVLVFLFALNFWLYQSLGLVLPLAGALLMATVAFALNMSYGYFVESRSKRELANLFGIYVPPELVDEMVRDPDSYSMKATNKELTVMFSDMRGFTSMAETMEPVQLQELLNDVFSRLTGHIRTNRGTIDKYMGDCVMAFWGAPVDTADHAKLAVNAAMEMSRAIQEINREHHAKGIPEVGIGIGLNTGSMCVGDMGSNIRRSYTVIGDAVNLGARLEGLSKYYGVDIVAGESTRQQVPEFAWQELDRVRVLGKDRAVAIYCPLGPANKLLPEMVDEMKTWAAFLAAYRRQDWDQSDVQLINLGRINAKKYLYQLYAVRVASMRILPFDPDWDGATNFETK
jgi:adenylate cyclase